ncbi:hypothetical protein L3Q65_38120 [Amycolatopsis sp. FU40]|uniref:hypothetical protein n=1 Tax=Amycolatopsis sp. FU40 TaxID=2914159 RepID=UPI001F45C77E|nr:hypothetical protein [Amycolatopsis sp. FU40]UKD53663.1 hypothetical protein L3Q65_38120 [Amycolatopsis sp. FU40]
MSEKFSLAASFVFIVAMAVLSQFSTVVNAVMTVLVLGVFVIGGILAVRFLWIMNARSLVRKRKAHLPPEQEKAVSHQ